MTESPIEPAENNESKNPEFTSPLWQMVSAWGKRWRHFDRWRDQTVESVYWRLYDQMRAGMTLPEVGWVLDQMSIPEVTMAIETAGKLVSTVDSRIYAVQVGLGPLFEESKVFQK